MRALKLIYIVLSLAFLLIFSVPLLVSVFAFVEGEFGLVVGLVSVVLVLCALVVAALDLIYAEWFGKSFVTWWPYHGPDRTPFAVRFVFLIAIWAGILTMLFGCSIGIFGPDECPAVGSSALGGHAACGKPKVFA